MKYYGALTQDIVNHFSGRKREGLIALIVNVRDKTIQPIPYSKEHIDFVCSLLTLESREELKKNPQIASHLIPSYIELKEIMGELTVVKIFTGMSSTEMVAKVWHTQSDLKKAHKLAHEFVENGDFPLLNPLEEEAIMGDFKDAA